MTIPIFPIDPEEEDVVIEVFPPLIKPELIERGPNTFIHTIKQHTFKTVDHHSLWYVCYKYTSEQQVTRLHNISVNAYQADFCKMIVYNDSQLTKPIRFNELCAPHIYNPATYPIPGAAIVNLPPYPNIDNNKYIKTYWTVNAIRNSFNKEEHPKDYLYENFLYRLTQNNTLKFVPDETNSLLTEVAIPEEGEHFNGRDVNILFGNNTITNKRTELHYIKPTLTLEERYGQ